MQSLISTQLGFVSLLAASEDNSTLVLDWLMFRVGSHVDATEFSIVSYEKHECIKRLDIGNLWRPIRTHKWVPCQANE